MSGLKKLRVLSFIKKTKLLKNGEAPIFIRITIDNERSELGLKKKRPAQTLERQRTARKKPSSQCPRDQHSIESVGETHPINR